MVRSRQIYRKILDSIPLRYQAKTPHGEHIYFGNRVHRDQLNRNTYPLGGLLELGSFGSLTYKKEHKFKNVLQLKGNKEKISFMESNPGIHIDGVRSFRNGVAINLIRRLYIIAKVRGAKYIYLETTNQRMEEVAMRLGFVYVGTDMANYKVYLKMI